jgi:hypothetical protein
MRSFLGSPNLFFFQNGTNKWIKRLSYRREKKMKTRLLAIILFFSLVLSACAAAATQTPSTDYYGNKGDTQSSGGSGGPAAPPLAGSPGIVSEQANGIERLVIKNASLEIVIDSPNAALQTISDMAQQMNGYVVSSNSYKTTVSSGAIVPQAKITLRVPADKLNEALAKIRALVKNADQDIHNETISGQDVTAEYTDMNSQLTNLQAAEKQLQAILEKSTKTEDVLSVFRELTSTRQQIDVIQGKMKYYERSAALSAIDVNIMATASVAPIEIAGWQPLGIARDAIQALIEIGKFLVGAVIWIVIVFVPLGLVFFFPIRLLRGWLGRNRKPGKPTVPPVAGTENK